VQNRVLGIGLLLLTAGQASAGIVLTPASFPTDSFGYWRTNALTSGDKIYTFISGTTSTALDLTKVDAYNDGIVYTLNNTNLYTLKSPVTFFYEIQITDPHQVFNYMRASENDRLWNKTAGSTTNVYTDLGKTNLLNTWTLLGTQAGAPYQANGSYFTIYVEEKITGVDSGVNRLSNLTFDVTQTPYPPGPIPIPEPASVVLLGMGGLGAAVIGRLRRRRA
jgi:hypothetical protein